MQTWAIAGQSGSGKSTLSYALQKHFGNRLTLLQLDDYFRRKTEVPTLEGFPNWDHPSALRWEDFIADIQTLQSGTPIQVRTRGALLNPNYPQTLQKLEVTLNPAEVLLLEGYLVLHHPQVRALLSNSFYLHVSPEVSSKRRDKLLSPEYESYQQKVLQPMAEQFVLPTRQHARHVINVGDMNAEQVFRQTLNILEEDQMFKPVDNLPLSA